MPHIVGKQRNDPKSGGNLRNWDFAAINFEIITIDNSLLAQNVFCNLSVSYWQTASSGSRERVKKFSEANAPTAIDNKCIRDRYTDRI